ncbi:MAG TPA: hypothetical protein DCE78_11925 [Bacteroidetes bacterium]|nr:hypothetical protein [Bacteroidota bacterium]
MDNSDTIVNKVANSNLITIDLEKLLGDIDIIGFDIKDFLFMELMLKEADFRESLTAIDWNLYRNKNIAVYCSTDAILAPWAFALVIANAKPFARSIYQATPQEALTLVIRQKLADHDWNQYTGRRIILKGCSDKAIPSNAYSIATEYLLDVADRIMYGEACSFVPIWRK